MRGVNGRSARPSPQPLALKFVSWTLLSCQHQNSPGILSNNGTCAPYNTDPPPGPAARHGILCGPDHTLMVSPSVAATRPGQSLP